MLGRSTDAHLIDHHPAKERGGSVVLTTPTQALLLYMRHCSDEPVEKLAAELVELVWEQPANLDKVQEWSRRAAGSGRTFTELRPRLETAQAEGIDLRRRRKFESRLPS